MRRRAADEIGYEQYCPCRTAVSHTNPDANAIRQRRANRDFFAFDEPAQDNEVTECSLELIARFNAHGEARDLPVIRRIHTRYLLLARDSDELRGTDPRTARHELLREEREQVEDNERRR